MGVVGKRNVTIIRLGVLPLQSREYCVLCNLRLCTVLVHSALCTVHYASIRLGVLPQSQEPAHKLQPPLIPPALDPHLVPLTFLKVDQSEEEIWSN